jgi:hypothetical protein
MAIPFQEFVTGRRSEPVRHEHRRVRHYSRALRAGVFSSIGDTGAKNRRYANAKTCSR